MAIDIAALRKLAAVAALEGGKGKSKKKGKPAPVKNDGDADDLSAGKEEAPPGKEGPAGPVVAMNPFAMASVKAKERLAGRR